MKVNNGPAKIASQMGRARSTETRKRRTPPKRTRLTVEDRRAQLLALGLRAFSGKAYDAISVDDIAAQAGISRGLIFHYFPTKHAYYLAVLGHAAEQLLAVTVPESAVDPTERLRAGLEAYFGFVERHGKTYAALLRGGVGSDPLVQRLVERTRGRIVETIRDALAPVLPTSAGGPHLRAGLRGWIGFVEALALDWIDHRDLTREEIVAAALRGIAVAVPGAEAIFRVV